MNINKFTQKSVQAVQDCEKTTRTGIKERRIATTEDTTSLAISAGRAALDASGLSAKALDLNQIDFEGYHQSLLLK